MYHLNLKSKCCSLLDAEYLTSWTGKMCEWDALQETKKVAFFVSSSLFLPIYFHLSLAEAMMAPLNPCQPLSLLRSPAICRSHPLQSRASTLKMSAQNQASSRSIQCTRLTSLRDIPLSYKGVFLDQFGVLQDGTTPYPGAIEGVKYLAKRGMKLLIISNSSRRKFTNQTNCS
jgi:Haloacid dehalogenase-like hydrolase